MIELKNVYKTYKSKKSKNTKALDGVSLTFADKGMTFILGKSGSGKSTLLNILGGLDKYDDGDMLILGKSSKDFTQADLDSYRNTYVGFIFQEFNILEDYDVYQNIVLALQLQQKEIDINKIDKLLDKLELTELKKRKVNELSGGQKQRVAIARALIKEPKIILADEPTGNLDSKTGKQVMELLKEISKETLVVVVSHDEEYAEKYGNRIVEIKDGKIIKDTKEVKEEQDIKNVYTMIKSHLPFKDSFKLGAGSLKHKKVKLFFTIILTVITLGFLSCADTLSNHSFSQNHANLLNDAKEQFIQIEKKHLYKDEDGDIQETIISMDNNSSLKVQEKLGKDSYDVYKFFDKDSWGNSQDLTSILHIQIENDFNNESESEIVTTLDISKILKENIIGRNPNAANEIVISNYVANLIIEKGIEVHEIVEKNEFKESKIFKPKTYDEILNTNFTYYFGNTEKVKIVGIVNYDLNNIPNGYGNNVLYKVFVIPKFITDFKTQNLNSLKPNMETDIVVKNKEGNIISPDYSTPSTILDHQIEYFDGSSWKKISELKENEVILNINSIVSPDEDYQKDLNEYINKNANYDYEKRDAFEKKFIANYITQKGVIGNNIEMKIYFSKYNGNLAKSYDNLKVIGVYYKDDIGSDSSSYEYNYFSSEILGEYIQKQFEKSSILCPMTNKTDFKNATDMFPLESELAIKTAYTEELRYEMYLLNVLKKFASYASLIFMAFTILLIANFMVNSINYRKKEIGTLRALGARSKDIVKIFSWEGFTLSLISGTVASILLVLVSNFMNAYIKSQIDILTTPFLVGIRQFVFIYFVVFLVTMVASILPIIRIAKMKPIDAILNK